MKKKVRTENCFPEKKHNKDLDFYSKVCTERNVYIGQTFSVLRTQYVKYCHLYCIVIVLYYIVLCCIVLCCIELYCIEFIVLT